MYKGKGLFVWEVEIVFEWVEFMCRLLCSLCFCNLFFGSFGGEFIFIKFVKIFYL